MNIVAIKIPGIQGKQEINATYNAATGLTTVETNADTLTIGIVANVLLSTFADMLKTQTPEEQVLINSVLTEAMKQWIK